MMFNRKNVMFDSILRLIYRYSVRLNFSSQKPDIHVQMMELNKLKKYRNAIALFNSYPQSSMNEIAINQALRACLYLNEFSQARLIHERLSPKVQNYSYTKITLIQIYCELSLLLSRLTSYDHDPIDVFCLFSARCNDIRSAQKVFESVQKDHRTTHLYTVMINGKHSSNHDSSSHRIISSIYSTCAQ